MSWCDALMKFDTILLTVAVEGFLGKSEAQSKSNSGVIYCTNITWTFNS